MEEWWTSLLRSVIEEWGGMEEVEMECMNVIKCQAYGPRLKIFVHILFCRLYVIIVKY